MCPEKPLLLFCNAAMANRHRKGILHIPLGVIVKIAMQ